MIEVMFLINKNLFISLKEKEKRNQQAALSALFDYFEIVWYDFFSFNFIEKLLIRQYESEHYEIEQ